MQKVVAVDIGNSSIKFAVGSKTNVFRIDAESSSEDKTRLLFEAMKDIDQSHQWLVCSVDREQTNWLESWVAEKRASDAFHRIAAGDIKLESEVKDRAALGRDRLLGAWFASVCSDAGKPAIVIDAGTAVTIDVVIPDRGHIGGLIFPGSETCLSAVSRQTDALPDLSKTKSPDLSTQVRLGKATEPAILLGVHQLQLFGMVAMVKSLQQQFGAESTVWCCGGGFESVTSLLPATWRYDRDFLIEAIFRLGRCLQR